MERFSDMRFDQLDVSILQSDLIAHALTHRSVGKNNNERLEFLGDSVLGFVITEYLFENRMDCDEGELTRLKAYLVNGDRLAEIAKTMGIGDHLNLGEGELKSGGYRRASILEDAFEAIIGAIYLLKGFDYTRQLILNWFSVYLNALPNPQVLKDAKTRLQEYLQKRLKSLPEYVVTETVGKQHEQTFTVSCTVKNLNQEKDVETLGQGRSRRRAEQAAAEAMIDHIEQNRT